jgi:glycosyltransferase involved in cell wall biosynthesis
MVERLDVLIPTANRAESLLRTLRCLDEAVAPRCALDIVVIDNANDQATRDVVRGNQWSKPVRLIDCQERGMSPAFNMGVASTSGELILFLNDDISVEKDHLIELLAGVERWPDAAAYGGQIKLAWPENTPPPRAEILDYIAGFAYVPLDYGAEDWIAQGLRPMEGNMAAWRTKLPDTPFDLNAGPTPGKYRMGAGETLFRWLVERGERFIYLPKVVVDHHIRPEQMTIEWIARRSFSYGRELQNHGMKHRKISGAASTPALAAQWLVRVLRRVAMQLRGKDYPLVWARVDQSLIEGILYERFRA